MVAEPVEPRVRAGSRRPPRGCTARTGPGSRSSRGGRSGRSSPRRRPGSPRAGAGGRGTRGARGRGSGSWGGRGWRGRASAWWVDRGRGAAGGTERRWPGVAANPGPPISSSSAGDCPGWRSSDRARVLGLQRLVGGLLGVDRSRMSWYWPVIRRDPRLWNRYSKTHSNITRNRPRKPIRKKMWIIDHIIQAAKPVSWTLPIWPIPRARPIVASSPLSQ